MSEISIENVQIAFPSVFAHEVFQGQPTGRYGVTILLPKAREDVYDNLVNNVHVSALEAANVKRSQIKGMYLSDGDETAYSAFAGHWIIKATSRTRPLLVDRNAVRVTSPDGHAMFEAGCIVNARIRPWVQNNQYGKRINCALLGLQFVEAGLPLGMSESTFTALAPVDTDMPGGVEGVD